MSFGEASMVAFQVIDCVDKICSAVMCSLWNKIDSCLF